MAKISYNAGRDAAKLKASKEREEKQKEKEKAAKRLAKKAERPASRRRNISIAGAALVALALAAVFVLRSRRPPGMALASPKPEATLTTPVFVWWSYPGVTGYELEVVSESGEQVYATSTRDTSAQAPADRFQAGQKYLWLVRAIVNGETKEASHIDRFTYQP